MSYRLERHFEYILNILNNIESRSNMNTGFLYLK